MEGKGNDGSGNVPERDLWETQQELWNKLDKMYNFVFDCCASQQNSKTDLHSDDFKSVKKEDITNMSCWMNPPFSKAFEMFVHFFKVVEGGVAIYRCDNMETKVWQEVILRNADWVFIPKGRVSYTPFGTGDMHNGMGTRFPSALIGVNVSPPEDIVGVTLKIHKLEVNKPSLSQNNKKEEGFPPTPKGDGYSA